MHYKKAAFYADLESIEKVAKKVNSEKETENDFFDFYCCMQKLSAYNFVGGELFFIFFFNGFRLSIWFLRFMVPIPNFGKKRIFANISAFC